jgi:hypothetical protein
MSAERQNPYESNNLMKSTTLLVIALAASALASPFSVRASLGGDMTSVRDDQAKLQGTLRSTSNNSYNVHEIQAASGVVLREYVSSSGKVFGVAWQGPSHPDLRQVLGAYYEQYVQAVQAQRAQRRGRGPVMIEQPGLVVETAGHMRALMGRAYIPQNMPAGVRAEEIR